MAIQTDDFQQDLSADSLTYTSSFGAAQVGQITLRVADTDLSDREFELESPVYRGIQERIRITLNHSAGSDFDCQLFSGNFNGRQFFVWTPPEPLFIDANSQITVEIDNQHQFGTVFGTITVNTI